MKAATDHFVYITHIQLSIMHYRKIKNVGQELGSMNQLFFFFYQTGFMRCGRYTPKVELAGAGFMQTKGADTFTTVRQIFTSEIQISIGIHPVGNFT